MPGPSRRAAAVIAVLFVNVPATASAQLPQLRGDEITLEEARRVLGADPAAIPGYPVKFQRLRDGVLVRQELDSGRVIQFREGRGPAPWLFAPYYASADSADEDKYRWTREDKYRLTRGEPSVAEERVRARQAYRKVGPVWVFYVGSYREPIPHELLDRLAPIP